MVTQGPPTPLGGAQQVPSSLLRSNSGLIGSQTGGIPQHNAFQSSVSPRNHFNNMNMLGNVPNVSTLLHQSFGNGTPTAGLSGPGSTQRGFLDNGAEADPLSGVGNGIGFNTPSSSFVSSSIIASPTTSGQVQGQQRQYLNSSNSQTLTDQQQDQQHESQNFQHNQQQLQQLPISVNPQHQMQMQQQQYQAMRAPGVGPVKLEPQVTNDQTQQQLQPIQNLGTVKLEPQQLPSMRSLAPVKMELQQLDTSLLFQQQQQQQLILSRQSSQADAQILQQQRFMQIQQQQQQLLKTMPQPRSPLQTQFQPHNLPIRPPMKPVYEPGMCARRLTHYMYQQQHKPADNNIEFWRKFVSEYFAPNAKKKWCVSMYGSTRQATGVFPQDVWHCEICNSKPGRGFEATAEVLPRLFKIKYESGTLEELLSVDMPREHQNSFGQIVLDYPKAIQESVFEQLRVVRDGHLRIVFSLDLKICSWEFCARRHEELIPRRLLIPQVSQLGAATQKYQATTQNASSNSSVSELQNNCNMLVASARQMAKTLEVPLVNDLGYTKRYVRCLQISEVVNSMKDLIDYSRETGTGPMESLAKFPRRTNPSPGCQGQPQQSEGQTRQQPQQTSAVASSSSNGISAVNSTLNAGPSTPSTNAIVGVVNQNSTLSRQQIPFSSSNGPHGVNDVQMPSPGSLSALPLPQPNSTFQSPGAATPNISQQTSHGNLSGTHLNSGSSSNMSMRPPVPSGDTDANDSQSSVQKIINDMRMSSQLGGGNMMGMGTMGNDMKNVNGMLSTSNSSNCLVGDGVSNNNRSLGTIGYGNMSNGLGQSGMVNGMQAVLTNNLQFMNGRVGMGMARQPSMNQQQQDVGNQLLSNLGTVNGFNNLQYDWKGSP